jgi:uncharacterized protein (DUF427 family)
LEITDMTDRTDRNVRVATSDKRVRAYLDGQLVVDASHPILVWESPRYPTYYFALDDIRAELVPTGGVRRSPSRGDGTLYDVVVPGSTARAAALRHLGSPIEAIRDLVRLEWDAMTEWFEEDEVVYTHARDPYTRVDILASSRHVRVEVDGMVVADSLAPRLLFETGLPTRYYLPMTDVRLDVLRPSTSETYCPYKGVASYLSLDADGPTVTDVAWLYRTPLPESQKIAGLVSFYPERADIYVDDVLQDGARRRAA